MNSSSGCGGVGGAVGAKSQKAQERKDVGHVFDKKDIAGIQAHFDKFGVVVVSGMLTDEQCDDLILEQWQKIMLQQHWTPEYKIVIEDENERELDPGLDADKPKFLAQVTGPLTPFVRKQFEAGWPLHIGFGAACDPVVWHMPLVWKLRQNPDLYEIAKAICRQRRLWVTLCRSIQVVPGQGTDEFLHWDRNMNKEWLESLAEIESEIGIQGKFMYVDGSLICVEGTHTNEFLNEFYVAYDPFYPNLSKDKAKFGLDIDKEDPMDLFGKRIEVLIPRGCYVAWHPRLCHGTRKNGINEGIKYGSYVGFNAAGSRPQYKTNCGVDELEDRLRSYNNGEAPLLYGSLDDIHFYPKMWDVFKGGLKSAIAKLPVGHTMIGSRIQQSDGKVVPILVPVPQVGYVPPELTDLGKKLLGLLPYEESDGVAGGSRVQAVPNVDDTESDDDKQAGPPLKKQCAGNGSVDDPCTLSD
jgi:hypothetical protein